MAASTPPPCPDPETTTVDGSPEKPRYVKTSEMRSEDDHDTCLRPLGLCELGGSCDSCWYRPDHPRFKKK